MIDWQDVDGSSRVISEAYDSEGEAILVRFPDGVEWAYYACSLADWEAFTAPGQSRGQYIAKELNSKPNGRWTG